METYGQNRSLGLETGENYALRRPARTGKRETSESKDD